jgi:hypothetical protein
VSFRGMRNLMIKLRKLSELSLSKFKTLTKINTRKVILSKEESLQGINWEFFYCRVILWFFDSAQKDNILILLRISFISEPQYLRTLVAQNKKKLSPTIPKNDKTEKYDKLKCLYIILLPEENFLLCIS